MEKDYLAESYKNAKIITRKLSLAGGNTVNVSLYREDFFCELSVLLPEDFDIEELKTLPSWKGMEINLLKTPENELGFKQLGGYDRHIFLLVMQSVVDSIEFIGAERIVEEIKNALIKWNAFFKRDSQVVLSAIEQQGLYGELLVLEKFLYKELLSVVNWTGCNKETHDFYLNGDAIEIKTSSKSGPDVITVSNEYQLDDADVENNLYLVFIKMKKSEVDGENLPSIVKRIHEFLPEKERTIFEEKLLRAGYIYQMPEYYKYCFRKRRLRCYEVKAGFPRLIASEIKDGIGNVQYDLSLDSCSSFEKNVDRFYEGVLA